MSVRNKLTVQINGKEYTLVSDQPREYMLEVSDYIDRKMTEVTNRSNRLSTSMAALLVALNVADDYFRAMEAERKYKEDAARYEGRIEALEKELAAVRSEAKK